MKPTPWDVLELLWCPRYLWLAKRHGVPTTPSMAEGKRREETIRKRLAEALGTEPRPVYIDAGWAHGVVDMVTWRYAAAPVEIKTGKPLREHKWQLYAEAYLIKAAGHSVHKAYLAYGLEIKTLQVTKQDLATAERLLDKAAKVALGPPPPPIKTAKCEYCQYRPICINT